MGKWCFNVNVFIGFKIVKQSPPSLLGTIYRMFRKKPLYSCIPMLLFENWRYVGILSVTLICSVWSHFIRPKKKVNLLLARQRVKVSQCHSVSGFCLGEILYWDTHKKKCLHFSIQEHHHLNTPKISRRQEMKRNFKENKFWDDLGLVLFFGHLHLHLSQDTWIIVANLVTLEIWS